MEICFEKYSKEEMYQVGNVIKKGSDLYLVATTHEESGGYFLISLVTGEASGYSSYDDLATLAYYEGNSGDVLVKDVKVVGYTE